MERGSSNFRFFCFIKMSVATRFTILFFLMAFILRVPATLIGQGGFVEQVDRALGSNQELVNGIQFTNQYIRSEGHPYWINGGFKTGSVCINDYWYEELQLRYNLFSQKLELGYLTPGGSMNLIITVPENISAFVLEGYTFRRLQIGDELPAYFQVVTWGGYTCYVRWSRDLLGNRSSGTSFSPIARKYWMKQEEEWVSFKDQRTYLKAFPKEFKRDLKRLLRQRQYYFQRASTGEMVALLQASFQLLEERGKP